jgi:acetylornithine deacetylase/succinyl-diaminopimelate desuccinylase-like protein
MRRTAVSLIFAFAMLPSGLNAKPANFPRAEAQALALARETMAMRSVAGPGNSTPEVAHAVRAALVGGGWADGDVEITAFKDTAYLIATWRGSDPALKPLVVSGHMDVVEARPADWERDPFTPVIEDGFLFGRGASDMKFDNALAVSALIELRRGGFRPRRTIVIAFSGDEETTMATSQLITDRLAASEMVINLDYDLNGRLDEVTGRPVSWTWQGAEKSYADIELTVTNPGGHSSKPSPDNAINQLAAALTKIGEHRFTPELNPLTKAHFEETARLESDPGLAAALRAFATDPTNKDAVATLSADPLLASKIATTCVATMIGGGHAVNALPQRATANINCRIFPGHTRADIMAELSRVIADPGVSLKDVTDGAVESPASPLRPDFLAAASKAIRAVYPRIPIVPGMALGASDCMWYRAKDVPCYVASPLFLKDSDYRSHGLNERVPLANLRPGISYYVSLFRDLAAK